MANVTRPNGAVPVRSISGAPWNGQAQPYLCPAADGTAVYVGDFVKLGGSAGAPGLYVAGMNCEGMPTAIRAAASDALLGVVVGISPLLPTNGSGAANLETLYRVASTNRVLWVVDDPNAIFEMQEDALGAALVAADIGENVDFVATAGSTVTGISAEVIDSSTHATTATLPLKLLRLVPRADNNINTSGATNPARFLVKINNHQFGSHTGTAGV